MCGLAGIFYPNDFRQPERNELQAMIGMLRHRGPDGFGFHREPGIGLAHARLSIIDPEGGAQPLANEDQKVWVVFNGEIFNYPELTQSLKQQGHVFATHSDTEVIVHLYEQYGEEFVHHLNGQFAIALWDRQRRRLLLVRDRAGIHPLFYHRQNERWLFASEAKAILAARDEPPSLDPVALDQIMTFWAPMGSTTVFAGIHQVRPGEMIVIDEQGAGTSRYWEWSFPVDGEYHPGSEADQADELHALLLDATRLRLRADVPVGAYLSGGLDSSVLTALIHENHTGLRTFSIGFEDDRLDEGGYQRAMIEHLGTKHSSIHCNNADIGEAFARAVWHTESPVLRTAPVPMMLLSGLVHEQGYKVVLTGEGADEVLGGYDIFKEAKIRHFWARNPSSRMRPLLLKRLYPYLDLSSRSGQAYLEAFFGADIRSPQLPHFSHTPRWTTTAKCKHFFSAEFRAAIGRNAIDDFTASLPSAFHSWHGFNRAQYIEAKSLMAGYLLSSQGDRMLMANSVEGRFPFLDHRVIEFANRLHPDRKMKVLNEKYLLKRAMLDHLPGKIVKRYKQPFRAPDIPAFFHGKTVPAYVSELLSEDCLRRYGYFDEKRVGYLLRKINHGKNLGYADNMALVGILSTQVWHHLFVDNYQNNVRDPAGMGDFGPGIEV